MKVYIVILNYNNWQDTIECLESLYKATHKNYQIIVVDNKSPNNSMVHIRRWAIGEKRLINYHPNSQLVYLSQPNIKKPLRYVLYSAEDILNFSTHDENNRDKNHLVLIQATENAGFAAGNNLGIRYALSMKDCEYIWLLNNDTVVKPNSLASLVSYANENDIGIAGSSLFYYHNPKIVQAYGGYVNSFFGTTKHIIQKKTIDKKLSYIIGASMLISRVVLEKMGPLSEEYFMYYEDLDYCFRATNKGFKLGVAIESVVYHKEGGKFGISTNAANRSEFVDLMFLKNRIKFHRKFLGGGVGLWIGLTIAFLNRVRRGQIDRIFRVIKDEYR